MPKSPPPPAEPVEPLIAAIRAGFEAYQSLYLRFQPYLYRIADEMISAELRAALGPSGVVQDSFLKIWQGFADFQGHGEAELRAWMRAILRNTLLSEQRKLDPALRVGVVSCPADPPIADPNPTPSSQAEAQEQLDRLRQAVQRLPDEQRLALLLHREHDLSDAQISKLLNRTPAAVREARYRALAHLRQQLGDRHE